ncbi:MAG: efflux RND transporter permease subunit, partial [Bacteroidetes bacterium]|nr:efflux RND transporter permease subunit [Bacteroidota bacterium]
MLERFLRYFIKHSVITNWVMIVICIAGVFGLYNLNKRIDPKLKVDRIEIDVPYPGASAVEVEEGIVIKIEESLRGLDGIEKVTS